MTSFSRGPIHGCSMSNEPILLGLSAFVIEEEPTSNRLTSQNITIPGFHWTRAWKSAPKAMWSYRKLSRLSLSSFLYPTILRVTITMSAIIERSWWRGPDKTYWRTTPFRPWQDVSSSSSQSALFGLEVWMLYRGDLNIRKKMMEVSTYNNWVLSCYWISSHDSFSDSAELSLLFPRMNRFQPM